MENNFRSENQMHADMPDRSELSVKDYHKQYMRTRKKEETHINIKPSVAKQLKEYHKEYVTICQQELFIPVDLHTFIIDFAEIGFLAWRQKHRGK